MVPRAVLVPFLLAVALLLAGCGKEEVTPAELEAREAEEDARMNLANAKAMKALQGGDIEQLAEELAADHRAAAKAAELAKVKAAAEAAAAAERAAKREQQEAEARRRKEELDRQHAAEIAKAQAAEEAQKQQQQQAAAAASASRIVPAVIRISGTAGPNAPTINGQLELQELRAPGEAPDYRKAENHDRWFYQGRDGRWWLATQELAIKREPNGWMRSAAASPQGVLPSFRVPWEVFDGKTWGRQDLQTILYTKESEQIHEL